MKALIETLRTAIIFAIISFFIIGIDMAFSPEPKDQNEIVYLGRY